MKLNTTTANDLILAIYRAAEDPAEWSACLAQINAAFGGTGTAIIYHDPVARYSIHAASGFSPETIKKYGEHYGRLDPWGTSLRPQDWVAGRAVDGREIISEAAVRKTEYFAELGHECAQAVIGFLEPFGSRVGGITVNRGMRHPRFDRDAAKLMALIAPHLCQALKIHRRLTAADGTRALACGALDRLAIGVVLVDSKGVPLFVNVAAAAIAQQSDGLTIDKRGLQVASPSARRQLFSAVASVARAVGASDFVTEPVSGTLPVPRPSGREPYSVVVVPAGKRCGPLGADVGAAAAVFITDPEGGGGEVLAASRAYGLTAAETRMAAGLVSGLSLRQLADELKISHHTARWHLKHVLHKAGVKTQAQLVSRMLRMQHR